MSKEICTVCGGFLRKGYYTDCDGATRCELYVEEKPNKPIKPRRLMVCKDCGLLYAKERDDD